VEANFPNPGDYHILPNAGICVTALLYGGGDFGKTIETAVMCGFDTDCNASNVGTILGVLTGDLPPRYRDPIRDTIVLSGVSGYLNMLDVPTFAKELAAAAFSREPGRRYRLRAEARGRELTLSVDGAPVLSASDDRLACGMAGVCHESGGTSRWSDFRIRFDTDREGR